MKKNRYRIKKLFSYSKRAYKPLIVGFVFTLLAVLADLVGPRIISYLLDNQLIDGLGPKDIKFYGILLGIYITTIIIASILRYISVYSFRKTANLISKLLQEDVFSHVQKLPIEFFDKHPQGKIVSRITNDTKDVRVLFQVVLSQLITAFIYTLGIFISLYTIDKKIFLLALIPFQILAIIFVDFKNKSKKFNYAYRRYLGDLNANLNENIQGIEIIHAFNKEDKIYQEFSDLNDKVYENGVSFTKLISYSAWNATGTLRMLTSALAILVFGYGILKGKFIISVGWIYVYIEYMNKIFDQMQNVIMRVGELEKARGAADHIFELLKLDPISYKDDELLEVRGNVEFKDLSFSYSQDKYVLKDINFSVKDGEAVAFVGHTGSGKSTIMNLIFAYYKANKGEILIDGKNINDLDVKELRRNMGIVLQDPYIFKGTIKDNVSLFDENISKEEVERTLLDMGGADLIEKFKDGVDYKLNEKGGSLSQGQRQVISFARAIIKNPKILVLDEATSSIDSETEKIIQSAIDKLKKGRTTFIIAHRLSTIKDVDRIYVLDKGRIIEVGSHKDLIEKDGVYKQMYMAQSKSLS